MRTTFTIILYVELKIHLSLTYFLFIVSAISLENQHIQYVEKYEIENAENDTGDGNGIRIVLAEKYVVFDVVGLVKAVLGQEPSDKAGEKAEIDGRHNPLQSLVETNEIVPVSGDRPDESQYIDHHNCC